MTATNINTEVKEICPLGGADLAGYKLGWLVATAKGAPNDTITIKNAKAVHTAFLKLTANGSDEVGTCATNIITLATAVTTGQVQGLIIYR